LLLELPYRPKKKLYWGHVHCSPPGGIRVDEGFVIVSNDLAQRFLREENKTLMCHPYGDQAMSMWINNIPGVTYFGDRRVHHDLAAEDKMLKYYQDICSNFLALHGSYPLEIEMFWLNYLNNGSKKKYSIPPITYPCGNMDKTFNYMSFAGMYNAKPKPCRNNPTWKIAGFYSGRNG
ncbi:uncharacterized protein LOC114544046, partial [Dendronephthya gigantea]|uniref:uncharacterized protein LOC114544046 n=1 Tax=Dendronephthya gigantea TaxID=151771 RepID=UPI00106CA971